MGTRTDYINRAKRFVKLLASYIGECHQIPEFCEAVTRLNNENHRKVYVAHGLTRVAFITSDYVIKIDYGIYGPQYGCCEDEVYMYEVALEDGYDYLFAPIEPYYYNNHLYYIMPRVYNIGAGSDDIGEYLEVDERYWIDDHIYDLHNENYGFDEHGNPIIVDYANVRSFV